MQFAHENLFRSLRTSARWFCSEMAQVALQFQNFAATSVSAERIQGRKRSLVFRNKILMQISRDETPQGAELGIIKYWPRLRF